MTRRRPACVRSAFGMIVALSFVVTTCLTASACGSDAPSQPTDRAAGSTQVKAENSRSRERATRTENAPGAEDGGTKSPRPVDEAPAGNRATSNDRPSTGARNEPDPDLPRPPVAKADDGFDFESLLDWGWLSLGLAGIALVVVIALGWVAWSRFKDSSGADSRSARPGEGVRTWGDPINQRPVDEPNPRTASAGEALEVASSKSSGRREFETEFSRLTDELKQVKQRLEPLERRVSGLEDDLDTWFKEGRILSQGVSGSDSQRQIEDPVVVRPQPDLSITPLSAFQDSIGPISENRIVRLTFPARVSECLVTVRERGLNSVLAAKTFVPGTLERSSSVPQAAFLIVDDGLDGGLYLALPNRTRLAEAQEYHSYYLEYYDCAIPSSGNLIIHSAAVVRASGGEWILETKGVFSVEQ